MKAQPYASKGKTPMFVSLDGRPLGMLCVADTIKEGAVEAIKRRWMKPTKSGTAYELARETLAALSPHLKTKTP